MRTYLLRRLLIEYYLFQNNTMTSVRREPDFHANRSGNDWLSIAVIRLSRKSLLAAFT